MFTESRPWEILASVDQETILARLAHEARPETARAEMVKAAESAELPIPSCVGTLPPSQFNFDDTTRSYEALATLRHRTDLLEALATGKPAPVRDSEPAICRGVLNQFAAQTGPRGVQFLVGLVRQYVGEDSRELAGIDETIAVTVQSYREGVVNQQHVYAMLGKPLERKMILDRRLSLRRHALNTFEVTLRRQLAGAIGPVDAFAVNLARVMCNGDWSPEHDGLVINDRRQISGCEAALASGQYPPESNEDLGIRKTLETTQARVEARVAEVEATIMPKVVAMIDKVLAGDLDVWIELSDIVAAHAGAFDEGTAVRIAQAAVGAFDGGAIAWWNIALDVLHPGSRGREGRS